MKAPVPSIGQGRAEEPQMAKPAKAISYRSKNKTNCPVCRFEFARENLHSGGGRLIAGKLTEELRRLYEVSKKFGRVYPLAYEVVTCPQCLYSAFANDFEKLDP